MSTIIPIPATRVPDQLARDRLVRQLSGDQIDLTRLQTQISTGRRVLLPSDDAPAALRGIALQQLIERKQQMQTNLQTNQSYLSATDTALSNVGDLLSSVRATALGVIGSTSTDNQRTAAAQQVDQALQQLIDAGNQKFRGRYLFSGSATTIKPFENSGLNVLYNGNETALQSYSDLDQLFQTNADGNTVFGSISADVQGTADLNPVLNDDTLLSDLRGGRGIAKGSIAISDGTTAGASIIDLSRAATIGDVKAMIEAYAPPGRRASVTINNTGLQVQLDGAGGGNLRIVDVGGGTTASDLGILHESGSGTGPVNGDDLNPELSKTTRLTDILGTHAAVQITSPGSENDLRFKAIQNGTAFNNVTIQFVDNAAVTVGNETVAYDVSNPAAPKLIFQIDAGNTSANDIIAALNNNPAVSAIFSASLVSSDTIGSSNDGTGLIDATATAITSGGSGIDFDKTSGIRLNVGGQAYDVSFATATTLEDVLNRINGSGAGVTAEINETGTGINLRSRVSGVDFSIGENGGRTAADLGIRTFNASTRLDNLNHGLGVHEFAGNDFMIRRKDGIEFGIDVSSATSIQDIIDRINNHVDNQDPAHKVTASLSKYGNGIELSTSDMSTTSTLAVIKSPLSQAAIDLGLIPTGAIISNAATSSGGVDTLTGNDVNPTEVSGAFTALIRLRDALNTNDITQINRAVELLDASSLNLTNQRAEIGARQQGLDILKTRLDNESVSLKGSLSQEIDVDMAQAISDYTSQQAAYQATLQTTAAISKLSLLDYL